MKKPAATTEPDTMGSKTSDKKPITIVDSFNLKQIVDTHEVSLVSQDCPSTDLQGKRVSTYFEDDVLEKEVIKLLSLEAQPLNYPLDFNKGDRFVFCRRRKVDKGSADDIAKTGYVIELVTFDVL